MKRVRFVLECGPGMLAKSNSTASELIGACRVVNLTRRFNDRL